MILYLKDLKDSNKTTLRYENHFGQSSKVQNQHTKISTNHKHSEREIKKRMTLTIASKRYRGKNLIRKMNDIYNENYKTLKKEIEENTRR
jgi:hypothetical protein